MMTTYINIAILIGTIIICVNFLAILIMGAIYMIDKIYNIVSYSTLYRIRYITAILYVITDYIMYIVLGMIMVGRENMDLIYSCILFGLGIVLIGFILMANGTFIRIIKLTEISLKIIISGISLVVLSLFAMLIKIFLISGML